MKTKTEAEKTLESNTPMFDVSRSLKRKKNNPVSVYETEERKKHSKQNLRQTERQEKKITRNANIEENSESLCVSGIGVCR